MTIFEYLQAKYGEDGPFVLTAMEAKAFGIKYPLQTGWIDQHGHLQISAAVADELANRLYQKGIRTGNVSKANYCLAGAALLRSIKVEK